MLRDEDGSSLSPEAQHPGADLAVCCRCRGRGRALGLMLYARTPYARGMQNPVEQPIQFDHRHHTRDEGIDCRYCHNTVDRSPAAGIPQTQLCLNCHSQVWNKSPLLEPVRESFFKNTPIKWNRVYQVPEFVYFNHSIHVNKGVGCVSCHGRVDRDAGRRKGHAADHEVVPRMPPPARGEHPPRRGSHEHGVEARRVIRAEAGRGCRRRRTTSTRAPAARPATDEDVMSCDDNHEARAKDRAKRRSLPLAAVDCGRAGQARPVGSAARRSTGAASRSATARGRPPALPTSLRRHLRGARASSRRQGRLPPRLHAGARASRPRWRRSARARSRRQKIVPYVRRPEEVTPGNRAALRDRVRARRLRERPAGREPRGAARPRSRVTPRTRRRWARPRSFEQNLVLGLYDDDRAKQLRSGTRPLAWRTFLAESSVRANQLAETRGAGLRFLTAPTTSPLLARSAPPDPRALPERQVRQLLVAGRRRRR